MDDGKFLNESSLLLTYTCSHHSHPGFPILPKLLHKFALDEFEVSLTGVQNELRLKVHDSDAGFDLKKTSNGHRLGLSSMKERLKPAKESYQLTQERKPRFAKTSAPF